MIFTSYFSRYKGTQGVSVANKTPDWVDCDKCKELMPSWVDVMDYKNGIITWKQFRKNYIRKLKKLDVKEFYNRLNGKVLLCWEATDKQCHRHILKEWFNRNGYACEELEAVDEHGTCSCCRNLNNHYSSSILCELTGEILTDAQQQARTCEDWRCRSCHHKKLMN